MKIITIIFIFYIFYNLQIFPILIVNYTDLQFSCNCKYSDLKKNILPEFNIQINQNSIINVDNALSCFDVECYIFRIFINNLLIHETNIMQYFANLKNNIYEIHNEATLKEKLTNTFIDLKKFKSKILNKITEFKHINGIMLDYLTAYEIILPCLKFFECNNQKFYIFIIKGKEIIKRTQSCIIL